MRALGRWVLWSLIGLGLMIGVLRLTCIRWWRVPSDDPFLEASVAPTLGGGDWILLWRMTEPTLGSLVICPEPKHADRVVVGRMVGDRRDKVTVEGSRIVVDEKAFGTEGACAKPRFTVEPPNGGQAIEQRCMLEAAHGTIHMRGDAEATAEVPTYEAELDDGEVLLISDNRRYPYDSRDFGVVDRATCKETVFFRLFGAKGFFDETTRFEYLR